MRGDQPGASVSFSCSVSCFSLLGSADENEVVCIEICLFLKYCLLLYYRQNSTTPYATIECRLYCFPLFRKITYAYLCSNISLQNAIVSGRITFPLTTP